MSNMKQMITKMNKEHSNEHLYAGNDDMSIGLHYMPAVLYKYVKRRHFDTIKKWQIHKYRYYGCWDG